MTLIAIFFCLALQRFAGTKTLPCSTWFETYLAKLDPLLAKTHQWIAVSLIISPVILFLLLTSFLFSGRRYGLFDLAFATVVLFLCIDARDLKNSLATYFSSLEKGNTQAAADAAGILIGNPVSTNSQGELCRLVTKEILVKSFERFFAGLFWFIIFGVYGVAVYFILSLICKSKAVTNHKIISAANTTKNILDQTPALLVGLSYALVGNFNKGFRYFTKLDFIATKNFSANVALAALDVDADINKASLAENHAALNIVNRVLVVWLAILTLVMFGSWF